MTPPPTEILKQPSRREDAINVIRRLRDQGHVAYLAGGCVRDELLGLTPKDFDVATDAPPIRVQALFQKTQAVGAAFGVILVRSGKSVIEVATFRADGHYSDGRRPDRVTFTTAEADAQRRDFTINGLFLDPIENRVIDYVGGQADLRANLLRAIGDPQHRFAEDYLRILRAVRFAARFEMTIEPTTRDAIVRYAPRLIEISPERIADELRGMLTPITRIVAWRLLWSLHVIGHLIRFVGTPPAAGLDMRRSIFERLQPGMSCGFPLAVAAAHVDFAWQSSSDGLFELLEGTTIEKICHAARKSLRISNLELDSLRSILRLASSIVREPLSTARIKRFLAAADSGDAIAFLRAISEISGYDWTRVCTALEAIKPFVGTEVAPLPWITGDDLIALGMVPGPMFKMILDRTYDEQLEGRITNRDAAVAFAIGLK
ncbi:MAG TPA: CCA tRNA nucleotidyltransferase [Tepidisphaeraceae bacterium]|nr:CCA tRNA nucleotidyltransferase [Tepidisphaeraceae bacterium]